MKKWSVCPNFDTGVMFVITHDQSNNLKGEFYQKILNMVVI